MSEIPYKEILLLIFGALTSYLLWRVQHQKEKIKDFQNQLSDKKHKLYSEMVNIVFDLIRDVKSSKESLENTTSSKILDMKSDLFLYAPDSIFRAFTNWLLNVNKPGNGVNKFRDYYKVMKLVRQEMGHRSTKIDLNEFMLFLMQDEEAFKKLKQINGWD